MGKKLDRDVKALRDAARALEKSTSPQMLRANLEFLWDRFIDHPARDLPDHLAQKVARK